MYINIDNNKPTKADLEPDITINIKNASIKKYSTADFFFIK